MAVNRWALAVDGVRKGSGVRGRLADRYASVRHDLGLVAESFDGSIDCLRFIENVELVEQASFLVEQGVIGNEAIDFAWNDFVPDLFRLSFGFQFRFDRIFCGGHDLRG